MTVLKVGLTVGSTSLCTVIIEEARHTTGVSLASSPIIACQRVRNGRFFLLSCSLLVHHVNSLLADEDFIFSQHNVLGMSSGLWLRYRVFRASQVDSSLWIVEVGDFAVLVDKDGYFAEGV